MKFIKIVNTGISLLLKVGQSTIDEINRMPLPVDPKGRELTRLKDEDLHVTLIGIKDFKKFKDVWDDEKVNKHFTGQKGEVLHMKKSSGLACPDGYLEKVGIWCEADIVEREDKISAVVSLEYESESNGNLYKNLVDEACECQGLKNPTPEKFYHITIANNGGGNPFKSIGDVTRADTCKKGNLVLVRGVSGSGKTTIDNLFQTLADSSRGGGHSKMAFGLVCNGALKEKGKHDYHLHNTHFFRNQECVSFSADDYFVKDGKYNFDKGLINDAHLDCQTKTAKAMQEGILTITVHNTFTEEWEMQAYFDLAEKHNYKVITLIAENRHESISTHNVPDEAINRQKERFQIKL
tara:strand:- start:37 stop:1089 length:1053 start_codon:yes stop_codon:yes gene_type:complete